MPTSRPAALPAKMSVPEITGEEVTSGKADSPSPERLDDRLIDHSRTPRLDRASTSSPEPKGSAATVRSAAGGAPARLPCRAEAASMRHSSSPVEPVSA